METVSPERKRSAKSHFCAGRGPWREGEAICNSVPRRPVFKGSAGASPSRVFAAAIRRLLDRDAMTAPKSTKLSAIGLDVLMRNVSSEGRKNSRHDETRRDNRPALTYPE